MTTKSWFKSLWLSVHIQKKYLHSQAVSFTEGYYSNYFNIYNVFVLGKETLTQPGSEKNASNSWMLSLLFKASTQRSGLIYTQLCPVSWNSPSRCPVPHRLPQISEFRGNRKAWEWEEWLGRFFKHLILDTDQVSIYLNWQVLRESISFCL